MAGPSRRGRRVGFEVVYEGEAAVGVAYEAAAVDIEEFGGGVVIDESFTCAALCREDRSEITGGYDCEFVSPPSDIFQTICPVCLQILKEPCVISCPCGKKLCRECVEQVKENNRPCPLCNKSAFTFMRDYGFERSLKELEVRCSHREDGCEWSGKLGNYEQHLNKDPPPENQLTGCLFLKVECTHNCGSTFQRQHMAAHQDKECPERPYSCEYCHEYYSSFEIVTEIHYPYCNQFPIPCPNKCREDPFQRQEIESHLREECPLTPVSCPLHYAGCEVRLPRKEMPEHMKDTVTHLTLLATVTQTLLKDNSEHKKIIEELKEETQKLQQHNQQLEECRKPY